jgi:hypothetical protein
MTQLLTDVGQMAFESIGFHAALILLKLRNKQEIDRAQEEAREADSHEHKDVGRELHVGLVDKKPGAGLTGVAPRSRERTGSGN